MMRNSATNNRLVIIGGIVAIVIVLLILSFVANLLSQGLTALLPLVAGALLVMANRKEAMSLWRARQANPALASALIGLSLILYGVGATLFSGAIFRAIFFIPSVLVLIMALPMAIGKPELFRTYGSWISSLTGRVRGRQQMQQPTQQINITQPNQQQQWYDQNRQN